MQIEKTKAFYRQITNRDLCSCAYCQTYRREIKAAYPNVAAYLSRLGVDIEKPFETMFLDPDESGMLEYLCAQYIVYGTSEDFLETSVDSVHIGMAGPHPSTGIADEHFVIELSPIYLKWEM